MANATSNKSDSMTFKRSQSSSTLRQTGQIASGTIMPADETEVPKIPRYLNVNGLTTRRKLAGSTGNIHGYMAEDYKQLSWPLPKMFGQEKYGFSLIDIDDPRFLKKCAGNSKKLIRLHYDQQIVDLEWRKTFKKLQDAEHRKETCGSNEKTKDALNIEVKKLFVYLKELQEQKDMYQEQIQEVFSECDNIKSMIKKETDLEELRMSLEHQTKQKIPHDAAFWKAKFNTRSPTHKSAQDRDDFGGQSGGLVGGLKR
jgi:DNA-binding protein H-NS